MTILTLKTFNHHLPYHIPKKYRTFAAQFMVMSILTEYSLWFGILCILLGAVISFALYFRNKEIDFNRKAAIVMAILRVTSIALIAFLLLAPMLRRSVKEVDKPMLIFAIDNSESMALTKDSLFYRKEFPKQLDELIHTFGDKYEVKTYYIGGQNNTVDNSKPLQPSFSDKSTNLSSIFDEVDNMFANHNVGAMVLVSDGIFNTGSSPQYAAQKVKFPIYTVATGDTTVQTDLSIANIIVNKQTFVGNYFPVEIKVAANQLAGKTAKMTIYQKDKEIFSKNIDIQGNRHFETVKLTLEAKSKGMQHYRVELTQLPGEITYRNNIANFFIEVVDQREKIAIVYYSPHPDVSALKQALETSDKYEVETFPAAEFNKDPNDYALFILHQLPSQKPVGGDLINKIRQNAISTLFIIGSQTNINSFNGLNCGVTIQARQQGGRMLFNESFPYFNPNFLTFTFSEEAKQMLRYYTPVITFFGDYKTAVGTNTFLYQKINNVESNYPLISFYQSSRGRIGIITGTDIWRWRMQNYLRTQNFDAFDEIINKIALYLSVKGDNGRFRVHAQELYNENSSVELTAEVYNESFEQINTPDVRFKLKDSEGKEFSSQFSKQNNTYYLNLGRLPVGDYEWEATTNSGGGAYQRSGRFTVQELRLESVNLVADYDVLRNLAQNSNGQFFTKDQLQQLEKAIKQNDNIKSIASYNKKYSLLLNSWVYLSVIILLMAIEWFMRKWGGGY